ncbi:MAG: Crp/Fnr family transcriptional regulator [Halarcobacter sp.]
MKKEIQEDAFASLKSYMDDFNPIDEKVWTKLLELAKIHIIKKNQIIYAFDDIMTSFFYIHKGLFRAYILDDKGEQYNKNFFQEYLFFGPLSPSMYKEPIKFQIESIEDGILIEFDNKRYRELLLEDDSLKLFHINYVEKRLEITKNILEENRMKDDAVTRYEKFTKNYPGLSKRLSLYHIASYLGITPTHLSRIRKKST